MNNLNHITDIQSKKLSEVRWPTLHWDYLRNCNLEVHYGDTAIMSDYDCRNKYYFSFLRNIVSDEADWTSSGRLFQSRGPAAKNERSPTVTSREGWRQEIWKLMTEVDYSSADQRHTEPIEQAPRCRAVKGGSIGTIWCVENT